MVPVFGSVVAGDDEEAPAVTAHQILEKHKKVSSRPRRLPAELRSLLRRDLGSGSDSDDDLSALVAGYGKQRVRAGRYRTALIVCLAVPLGVCIGGLAVAYMLTSPGATSAAVPGEVGSGGDSGSRTQAQPWTGTLALEQATAQCAEARSAAQIAQVTLCSEAGGYCTSSQDQCGLGLGAAARARNKIHFPCSPNCGCCVDKTRCPDSWKGDNECDAACNNEEHGWDEGDCRGTTDQLGDTTTRRDWQQQPRQSARPSDPFQALLAAMLTPGGGDGCNPRYLHDGQCDCVCYQHALDGGDCRPAQCQRVQVFELGGR
eukprot:COSAG01_NODE_838_length_13194_cov_9.063240_11_plen_317_part_00